MAIPQIPFLEKIIEWIFETVIKRFQDADIVLSLKPGQELDRRVRGYNDLVPTEIYLCCCLYASNSGTKNGVLQEISSISQEIQPQNIISFNAMAPLEELDLGRQPLIKMPLQLKPDDHVPIYFPYVATIKDKDPSSFARSLRKLNNFKFKLVYRTKSAKSFKEKFLEIPGNFDNIKHGIFNFWREQNRGDLIKIVDEN